MLLAQVIHMLLVVRPWQRLAKALFLFGAICLGFLPWLPVVIDQNSAALGQPAVLPECRCPTAWTRTAPCVPPCSALLRAHGRAGAVGAGLRDVPAARTGASGALRPLWPVLYLVIWIGLMVGLTVVINERRQFLTVRNFIIVVHAR